MYILFDHLLDALNILTHAVCMGYQCILIYMYLLYVYVYCI